MNLFENIEKFGSSMDAAIKNLADEMLGIEIGDDEVKKVIGSLKLSDLLVLDTAYTTGDKEKVASILGLELNEYSMGRNATSAASARPKPGRRETPQASSSEPTSANTTQTNRNYNAGASNAVTSKKVSTTGGNQTDMDDQGEEELEETVIDMIEWLQRKAGLK